MKTRILLIVMLGLIGLSGMGQTNIYHAFPDSNACWGEMNSWSDQSYNIGCMVTDEHKLFMAGDTLIGSYHYQKLMQSGYFNYSNWCISPGNVCCYFNNYKGAIRQDTSQKKVYIFIGNQDQLLYDFNLSLGDTLPQTANNFSNNNIVSRIDSVLVGNEYRKRFRISMGSSPYYISLIEGIGSTLGLLDHIVPWFEGGSGLHCFHWDNISYLVRDTIGFHGQFTDSSYDCNLDVGIIELNNNSTISISPNPFTTQATLTLQSTYNNPILFIYNLLGQEVRSISVGTNKQITIQRNQLPSGMYFYKLIEDNKGVLGIGKFIIYDF